MATVWWLQKLVCDLNAIYFVSAIRSIINIDTKKDSKIFNYFFRAL